MRRVGTVSGAANGVVVARCDGDPPEVGTDVVDESLDAVGRVVDVFGPVEAPYVAVSPRDGVVPATLLGGRLYAR